MTLNNNITINDLLMGNYVKTKANSSRDYETYHNNDRLLILKHRSGVTYDKVATLKMTRSMINFEKYGKVFNDTRERYKR